MWPFSFFIAFKYRPRTASVYSSMLALVIVTSNLGNTYFEATTPASVTVIMSQFGPHQMKTASNGRDGPAAVLAAYQ
jgi:hypothetical protein